MDNPLYEAALEGRYQIDIDVTQRGDEYVATYNRHGLNVEVVDSSPMTASNLASQKVLEQLKDLKNWDQIYG